MANTDITVSNRNGVLVPSLSSVKVVEGDTVVFSVADRGSAALFFSPDAAAVLSPAPAGPVELAAGSKASFTFRSSQPGAYSVFFEPNSSSRPAAFPADSSEFLKLEIDFDIEPGGFEVQNNSMKTG